jgi:hypothetical protein
LLNSCLCATSRELRRAADNGGRRHCVVLLAVEELMACVGSPRQRALSSASGSKLYCRISFWTVSYCSISSYSVSDKAEYNYLYGTNWFSDVNIRCSYISWVAKYRGTNSLSNLCGQASMEFSSCNHFTN